MRLILLGPPGAGKGTQAAKIEKKFNLSHVSTGDIFRNNIKEKTELGKKVEGILKKGGLVSDDITIDLVKDKFNREGFDDFLLDGFPRNLVQAKALDEFLDENNVEIDCVVNINVLPEILIERVSGRRVCLDCGATYHVETNPPKVEGICDVCGNTLHQREDDKEETVKERISIYESQTAPLIDYYNKQNKLIDIDGAQGVDEVYREIERKLNDLKID